MSTIIETAHQERSAHHNIHPLILGRWSPRAMSGETISQEELGQLFEAARWAPSSYNSQPWKFLYAEKGSEEWKTFFDLMVEFNQSWAKDASHLVVIVSKKNFEHNGEFSPTHSFDTGAAWQNLALQGAELGLVIHGIGGFDYDRARKDLNIPDDCAVEAMIAVGKPGKKESLPTELQEKEAPTDRKKIEDFAWPGSFPQH